MADKLKVLLPSGDVVPGVLVRDYLLELGPSMPLGIGERITVNGRRAMVMGHLRGRRVAVEGLWEAGPGRQAVIQWSDEPVR